MEHHANIFFLETSGALDLNHRQACSVETAAKYNADNFTIHLFMNVSRTASDHNSFVDVLKSFYKINIVPLVVTEMVRGTPVEHLFLKGKFNKSPYKVYHLSDLLRLLLIWSHGGIYLDLDCFVLRSFIGHTNFTVMEHAESLANGIFGFKKHHPFLEACLKDFSANYNPGVFAGNGPALFTRNARNLCHQPNLTKIVSANCGITCLPRKYAFELFYTEVDALFKSPYDESALVRINSSQVVHLWNFITHKIKNSKVGGNSLVDKLMRENCPIIYSELLKRKIKFL